MKKVAVSACLLGQAVRYDGLSKRHLPIINYLSTQLELIAFCPEVGIGLSIPREKIHLCYNAHPLPGDTPGKATGKISVKEINNSSKDYTTQLSDYARNFMAQNPQLSAIILKSKSPSCGLLSTPIVEELSVEELPVLELSVAEPEDKKEIKKGSGQFAYIIKTEYKSIILIEESNLETRIQCQRFLSLLYHQT